MEGRTFSDQATYNAADDLARKAGFAGVATWREAYDKGDTIAKAQGRVVQLVSLLSEGDSARLVLAPKQPDLDVVVAAITVWHRKANVFDMARTIAEMECCGGCGGDCDAMYLSSLRAVLQPKGLA